MADPLELRGELDGALELAFAEARRYLGSLDAELVREPGGDEVAAGIGGELPEEGDGALAAVHELMS